jgi:RNA polymerase sigma-70 factor (ECF subfamily)
MSDKPNPFRSLMERVQAGSEDAARQLLDEYGPQLIMAVRRRMNQKLRPKFDSLDFVQDVWASFFANPPDTNTCDRPGRLVVFLARLARNKVVEAVRQRLRAEKFNVNVEQSLQGSAVVPDKDLIACQPTPSQVAMDREAWERFLAGQPPVYRRVWILLREGHSPPAVAVQMGVSVRTVQRAIRRFLPGVPS